MKRSIKKNAGVYAFLDRSGLLENGTGKAIEQAKKQYWKDYRKKYNKIKRQENTSFQIFFNFKKVKRITQEAKKYHTSPTNYIKQSALANNKNIFDPVVVGEIRELVILHHNALRTLTEENKLSQPISDKLLNQASELEKKCLTFFHHLNSSRDC